MQADTIFIDQDEKRAQNGKPGHTKLLIKALLFI